MKKEEKRKYIKTNIISFIIEVVIFGSIGVYAVVTFSSNDVTYDNTESGLTSTNVKGAIDELYEECTTVPAGEQIIEDGGLEKDPYECRYFFTGANPNNYITFNGETAGWRILSVECDGTIKIIRVNSIGNMAWDSSGNSNWTRPATLNTYLNETYLNDLNSEDKNQIVVHEWSIGEVTYGNNNLEGQLNDENSKKWNGKIALPTVSEYLRTNSNASCKTISSNNDNYNTCKNTTWMFNNEWQWTLSPYAGTSRHAYNITYTGSIDYNGVINTNYNIRPTLYLSSDIKLSGSGTQSDPYVIE